MSFIFVNIFLSQEGIVPNINTYWFASHLSLKVLHNIFKSSMQYYTLYARILRNWFVLNNVEKWIEIGLVKTIMFSIHLLSYLNYLYYSF